MKKLLLLFTFYFSLFIVKAQDIKRTWHWNFGAYAGLDFSSGSPVTETNSAIITNDQGCSSISDTNGNLLFYTNGQTVWNKNNAVMANGTQLLADPYTEGVVIVPQPLNDSIYYVFTANDTNVASDTGNGFCYSVIDMNLNGGLGGVIKKNSLLDYQIFAKIAAVKHANDTDIWIVSIRYETDTFFAYRLTPAGLDTIPVKSECGRADSSNDGNLKFSPSGTKLALTIQRYYGFDLLKFNDTTGQVYGSSPSFPYCGVNCANANGIEFSPDESKLYWTYESNPGKELWQANLLAGSNIAIANSVIRIDSLDSQLGQGTLENLQLASDGKIYLANFTATSNYVGVINTPNSLGTLCNFKDSAVFLPSPSQCYAGLPNFVSSYFYNKPSSGTGIKNISNNYEISVYPNPSNGVFHVICYSSLPVGGEDSPLTLQVHNMVGQLIFTETLRSIQSNNIINVGNQPLGIYILSVNINNQMSYQKLIINH